jgi:hypothetical protein
LHIDRGSLHVVLPALHGDRGSLHAVPALLAGRSRVGAGRFVVCGGDLGVCAGELNVVAADHGVLGRRSEALRLSAHREAAPRGGNSKWQIELIFH